MTVSRKNVVGKNKVDKKQGQVREKDESGLGLPVRVRVQV